MRLSKKRILLPIVSSFSRNPSIRSLEVVRLLPKATLAYKNEEGKILACLGVDQISWQRCEIASMKNRAKTGYTLLKCILLPLYLRDGNDKGKW